MTAAEKSFIGLAKQTAKGTPNTNDGDFDYILFRSGGVTPQNIVIPLDAEVGGGAMARDMVKVGVTSGGALDIIPRPHTLGHFLLGALGAVSTVDNLDGSYTHTFTLPADQFSAPYFTVRSAPGDLWGEQFQDCRVAGLALAFAGARFVDGAVTFMGGLPSPADTVTWNAAATVDDGPQFLGPTTSPIELPAGTAIKVLSGAVNWGLAIPLDEQWIIGSYSPDDLDINMRSMAITLAVKITDDTLYKKLMYDGVGAASQWTANIFKEGQFTLELKSPVEAAPGVPYACVIRAHDTEDNVIWSAAPIALRAGRQIVMAVTGVVVNTNSGDPIAVDLTNQTEAY